MTSMGLIYLLPKGSFFQNLPLTLNRPAPGSANNLLETQSHNFVVINMKGVSIKYGHSWTFQERKIWENEGNALRVWAEEEGRCLCFSLPYIISNPLKPLKNLLVKSVQQTVLELAPFGGRSLNLGYEKTKAFSSVREKNGWWQKKCLCSTIVWVWKCQILLTKTQELCPSLCFWLWWQSNREAHLKWWKKASNPWVTLRFESSLFIS